MIEETFLVDYQYLLSSCIRAFTGLGMKEEHARYAAEAICGASLNGTDSHGIRLIEHYLKAIKAKRIVVDAEFAFNKTSVSTGVLDANHGMGHAAVSVAMDNAIKLANESGSGFVSVLNSNHCGAMAYYATKAAKKDMIGFAFTNATAKLKVFNSTNTYFGINPICMAAPMEGEEPFCYDAAPTVMSNNKIKLFAERGERIPDGVAADANGQQTTAPNLSRMLLPLGGEMAGYKGYGMAMMVDIMCSLLSGMPGGKEVSTMYPSDGGNISDKRYLAQFVGAIRIDAFQEPLVFKKRLKKMAEEIRNLPSEAGNSVMIPGDPEKKMKYHRLKTGIPITSQLIKLLKMEL